MNDMYCGGIGNQHCYPTIHKTHETSFRRLIFYSLNLQ